MGGAEMDGLLGCFREVEATSGKSLEGARCI